jgi:hypothetical protein
MLQFRAQIRMFDRYIVQLVRIVLQIIEFIYIILAIDEFMPVSSNTPEVVQSRDSFASVFIRLTVPNRNHRPCVYMFQWFGAGKFTHRRVSVNQLDNRRRNREENRTMA